MEDHNYTGGYSSARVKDRAIDELIGICKGVLFDGAVSTGEAQNLLIWLTANPIVAKDWIGLNLYQKLLNFLDDGVIDQTEEAELLNILIDITGRPDINLNGQNAATTLPLCKDPPSKINPNGKCFVLTGNFTFGKRKDVETYIEDRGGLMRGNPTKNTHFLVIGDVGSSAWMHSSFGRKIEKAVTLREGGQRIAIITETHLFASIKPTPSTYQQGAPDAEY